MNAEMLWLALQAEGYTDVTLERLTAMDAQMREWMTYGRAGVLFINEEGVMTRGNSGDFGVKCFEEGRWVITSRVLERVRRRALWWGDRHGRH